MLVRYCNILLNQVLFSINGKRRDTQVTISDLSNCSRLTLSLSDNAESPLFCGIESISMTGIQIFFFNSTAWSGTDAKTFLELAVFPSGRPAHSAVVFSIFNHPLFSKPLTLLAVPVKRKKEEIE